MNMKKHPYKDNKKESNPLTQKTNKYLITNTLLSIIMIILLVNSTLYYGDLNGYHYDMLINFGLPIIITIAYMIIFRIIITYQNNHNDESYDEITINHPFKININPNKPININDHKNKYLKHGTLNIKSIEQISDSIKNKEDKYISLKFDGGHLPIILYIKNHDKLVSYYSQLGFGHLKKEEFNKLRGINDTHIKFALYKHLYEQVFALEYTNKKQFIMQTRKEMAVVYTLRINFSINKSNTITVINISPIL